MGQPKTQSGDGNFRAEEVRMTYQLVEVEEYDARADSRGPVVNTPSVGMRWDGDRGILVKLFKLFPKHFP